MKTQLYALLAYWPYAGVSVLAVIEWWLPRTDRVQAHSTLELIANVLRRVPKIGALAAPLATKSDEPPAPPAAK